jgi:hypothetical protein
VFVSFFAQYSITHSHRSQIFQGIFFIFFAHCNIACHAITAHFHASFAVHTAHLIAHLVAISYGSYLDIFIRSSHKDHAFCANLHILVACPALLTVEAAFNQAHAHHNIVSASEKNQAGSSYAVFDIASSDQYLSTKDFQIASAVSSELSNIFHTFESVSHRLHKISFSSPAHVTFQAMSHTFTNAHNIDFPIHIGSCFGSAARFTRSIQIFAVEVHMFFN